MNGSKNRVILLFVCLVSTIVFANSEAKSNSDNRLQFITEPVSAFAAVDGRRVPFKCVVSPPEASIKWLLNGRIISNDNYEWIKINNNKLVVKMHKASMGDNGYGANKHLKQSEGDINLNDVVFQCLAELNNQVIVSQPAKLIIAELQPFEHQQNIEISSIVGNTVVIPCHLPRSIPFAVAEFEFNNSTIDYNIDRYRILPSGNLQIFNVKQSDSGNYRCVAHNPYLQEKMFANHFAILKVFKSRHHSGQALRNLRFVDKPKESLNAITGSNVTFECVASGIPVPKISWSKLNGELPKIRSFVEGGNLVITTIEKGDEGTYICTASNGKATISSNSILEVYEIPQIIDDIYESIDIYEGQDYNLMCNAKGQPKPLISWLHNGYYIDSRTQTEDISISQDGTILRISNANSKLNKNIFQCFATNELGSAYTIKVVNVKSYVSSAPNVSNTGIISNFNVNKKIFHLESNHNKEEPDNGLDLIDEETSINRPENHSKKKHKNKDSKMIPPSKPEISKLNDDSVMVRWSIPKNGGLPIMFFKVQYREIGKGDWNTVDEDIPPHIFSYAVGGLNSNSTYRFRIAAVYSNDDNKNGRSSSKFVFQKDPLIKKPSHPPTILSAAAITPNQLTLEWEFLNIEMIPIDGFFIYYRATDSAGEYLKVTSLGVDTRRHNVTHLLANTAYEIKMRCFNSAGTSEFSNIYTIKTLADSNVSNKDNKIDYENTDNDMTGNSIDDTNNGLISTSMSIDNNKMQMIVIIIVCGALALVFVACLVICIIRQKNHAPASKVVKKAKPLKTVTPSDYYFTSTNVFDRRSNGQLSSMSASNSCMPQLSTDSENESNQVNIRVNPLNEMSSLSRRNSLRNSLSYSSHHLFNGSNGVKSYETPSCQDSSVTTATIDRKRPIKASMGPYLDYSRMNHHSASFTRLNGTLERKRRSRTDLNTLDRSYGRNISTNEIDRNSTITSNYFPPNGQIVIMQSSC